LGASSQTEDFAGSQGVGMVNDWSSLLFKINPSRFYQSRRVDFGHRLEIIHGLIWDVGLKWEERKPLSNSTHYSWFYKESRSFTPNIPHENRYVNGNRALIDENRSAVLRMSLSYTPMQYYRLYDGRKTMRTSKYPTFSVEWLKGIPDVWSSESDFDFTQFQIAQTLNFGYYNTVEYQANVGKFWQAKQLFFQDYHHIYSNQSGVSFSRGLNALQLLPTYSLSTPEWFVAGRARYMAPYIALKYLPIFKSPFVREGIQVSYLLQPSLRHYVELGYSINNLFMMFDVGVFVGFEQAKYRSWGFRLAVPLEQLMNALQL
jgi:hypothetical protein